MASAARAVVLGLALLVPGCSLVEEPRPREVAGPTDGYLAGSSFLKVYVRSNSSGDLVLVDFDRRDWYVARIAEAVDHHDADFMTVTGTVRLMNEYVVERVREPAGLDAYRYDDMHATADDRARMDAEYDALLARIAAAANVTAPSDAGVPPVVNAPAVPIGS